MATYREIQDWVRLHSGFVPKTCWIAHVKADLGLVMRASTNRYDHPTRVNPCPGNRRSAIEAALRHFEMAGQCEDLAKRGNVIHGAYSLSQSDSPNS